MGLQNTESSWRAATLRLVLEGRLSRCIPHVRPGSGRALVVLQPDVSSAVRQAQNRSLVATAAALSEQMLFGFLQKHGESLIRHH